MLLQDIVNKSWEKNYSRRHFSGLLLSVKLKVYLKKFIPTPEM